MSHRGFTLLEISITVGILVLVGALGLVSLVNSRRERDLITSGQNVMAVLRLAQAKAIAGENNTQWGAHLGQTQFVLFRGPTYVGSPFTQTHVLPTGVVVANINLSGGGSDIVFQRLDGRTGQAGSFSLQLVDNPGRVFSITIDGSGKVYQTGLASTPTNTRIVDTRHRSFNLGWSIRNSGTMTLIFSGPDLTHAVAMASFFNTDRTSFDWSGTVIVGGEPQILRIHTTSLTDTNTVLSVDRDCRTNSKRVRIQIDTNEIATYEANCQTVSVGPYGGTISEP